MIEQDIKRGHYKNIEGERFEMILTDIFGDFKKEDGKYIVYFGALAPLTADIVDKSTLAIDTQMKTDVALEDAVETRKKYNEFLDTVTGFTSKQRRKRLSDKIKKGKK